MSAVIVISPRQVFEAIKYAMETNKDKYGDSAFRINYNKIKPGSNGVKYCDFEILHKKDGKWEYIPLNLKLTNIITRSRILPPNDPKRKFPGVQLQFAHDSSYTTILDKKDSEGKPIKYVEEYGKAKILIAKAFSRLMGDLLDKKKIFNKSTSISTPVQFQRTINEQGEKADLDKPIIRTEIKMISPDDEKDKDNDKKSNKKDKDISPNATPLTKIYDVRKKIDESDPRYSLECVNFEELKYEFDGKELPITYENIGKVILPGSSISGVECMSSVTFSNMGIGLPSKMTAILVKPSKGFKPDIVSIFSKSELNSMHETIVQDFAETDESENPPGKNEDNEKNIDYFKDIDEINKLENSEIKLDDTKPEKDEKKKKSKKSLKKKDDSDEDIS